MTYPRYFRAGAITGRMVYRGVTIEVWLRIETRPPFDGGKVPVPNWERWYSQNGVSTPNLRAVLGWIDYSLSGVPVEVERLRALPVGSQEGRFLKTDFQGEHEDAGNWFVNVKSGKTMHYSELAALRCNYTNRWEKKNLTTAKDLVYTIET